VLLAVLLLRANRVVSRDALVHELWGECAPDAAAHRLEEHVSRLRRTLHHNGEAPLETRPNGYRLRIGDGGLDVGRFDRLVAEAKDAQRPRDPTRAAALLREALALWRGPPFEDVALDSQLEVTPRLPRSWKRSRDVSRCVSASSLS
jgi:DNA-binding SARP family transcriptional activator